MLLNRFYFRIRIFGVVLKCWYLDRVNFVTTELSGQVAAAA